MATTNNIQEAIQKAVDVIVKRRIEEAQLDKTITATIKNCVDVKKRKYSITYNGGILYAYANEGDTFLNGETVYVLIPKGDFSTTLIILGLQNTSKGDEATSGISATISNYTTIGGNVVYLANKRNSVFGLHSYRDATITQNGNDISLSSLTSGKWQEINILYDKDRDDNYLDILNDDLKIYLKDANAICIGGYFNTKLLSTEQKSQNGDYGLVITGTYKTGSNEYKTIQEKWNKFAPDSRILFDTVDKEYPPDTSGSIYRIEPDGSREQEDIYKDLNDFKNNIEGLFAAVKTESGDSTNLTTISTFQKKLYNIYTDLIKYNVKAQQQGKNSSILELGSWLQTVVKNLSELTGPWTNNVARDNVSKFENMYNEQWTKDSNDYQETQYIYYLDASQFIGNPYNLNEWQYQYAVYEVSNDLVSIDSIIFYKTGFISRTGFANYEDILVKNIEIKCLQSIGDESGDYKLEVNADNGSVFHENENDVSLYFTGKMTYKQTKNVSADTRFYWFKKDKSITTASTDGYHYLGGYGWRRLGNSNTDRIKIDAEDNQSYKNVYECVAVDGDTILKKEFYVYNMAYSHDVNITSYINKGINELTCSVDGESSSDNLTQYKFVWTSGDTEYKTVDEYNQEIKDLQNKINTTNVNNIKTDSNWTQERKLQELGNIIKTYDSQIKDDEKNLEIVKNNDSSKPNIFNYDISNMKDGESVDITCTVLNVANNGEVGSATYTITNNGNGLYLDWYIVIDNGDQTFQYDEAGVSPTNERNDNPLEIQTLTATLYAADGTPINSSNYDAVFWHFPQINTLINFDDTKAATNGMGNQIAYTTSGNSCSFTIKDSYDYSCNNNQIVCEIMYNGISYKQSTNFYFGKVGDNGTNGTDIVAKIFPTNINANSTLINEPLTLIIDSEGNAEWNTGASINSAVLELKLYKRNEVLDSSTYTGVKWKIAGGDSKYLTVKALTTDITKAVIGLADTTLKNPTNLIVEAEARYKDEDVTRVHYAFYPICVIQENQAIDYNIALNKDEILQYVLYNAEGCFPQYNHNQGVSISLLDDQGNTVRKKLKWETKGGSLQDSKNNWLETNCAFGLKTNKDDKYTLNLKNYITTTYTSTQYSDKMQIAKAAANEDGKYWYAITSLGAALGPISINDFVKNQTTGAWNYKNSASIKYWFYIRDYSETEQAIIDNYNNQIQDAELKNIDTSSLEQSLADYISSLDLRVRDFAIAGTSKLTTVEKTTYGITTEIAAQGFVNKLFTADWLNENNEPVYEYVKDSDGSIAQEASSEVEPITMLYIQPNEVFGGGTANHYTLITILNANNIKEKEAQIYIPVCLTLNTYENTAINGWDGLSIDIDNDNGSILAPQVGAGEKNDKNQFTGIVMGKETGYGTQDELGLFGYKEGKRSIFLDAQTGNATFGLPEDNPADKTNPLQEAQIVLRPGDTSSISGWRINSRSFYKVNSPTQAKNENIRRIATSNPYYEDKNSLNEDKDDFNDLVAPYSDFTDSFGAIPHDQGGILLSSNPVFASFKSNPFSVDNDKIDWTQENIAIQPEDSFELELNPSHMNFFTLYRHTTSPDDTEVKYDADKHIIINANAGNVKTDGSVVAQTTLGTYDPDNRIWKDDSTVVAEFYGENNIPRFYKLNKNRKSQESLKLNENGLFKDEVREDIEQWSRIPALTIDATGRFTSQKLKEDSTTLSINRVRAFPADIYTAKNWKGLDVQVSGSSLIKFFGNAEELDKGSTNTRNFAPLYISTSMTSSGAGGEGLRPVYWYSNNFKIFDGAPTQTGSFINADTYGKTGDDDKRTQGHGIYQMTGLSMDVSSDDYLFGINARRAASVSGKLVAELDHSISNSSFIRLSAKGQSDFLANNFKKTLHGSQTTNIEGKGRSSYTNYSGNNIVIGNDANANTNGIDLTIKKSQKGNTFNGQIDNLKITEGPISGNNRGLKLKYDITDIQIPNSSAEDNYWVSSGKNYRLIHGKTLFSPIKISQQELNTLQSNYDKANLNYETAKEKYEEAKEKTNTAKINANIGTVSEETFVANLRSQTQTYLSNLQNYVDSMWEAGSSIVAQNTNDKINIEYEWVAKLDSYNLWNYGEYSIGSYNQENTGSQLLDTQIQLQQQEFSDLITNINSAFDNVSNKYPNEDLTVNYSEDDTVSSGTAQTRYTALSNWLSQEKTDILAEKNSQQTSISDDITELENTYDTDKNNIIAAQSEVSTADAAISAKQNEITNYQKQIDDINTQIAAKQTEIDSANTDLQTANSNADDAKDTLNTKVSEYYNKVVQEIAALEKEDGKSETGITRLLTFSMPNSEGQYSTYQTTLKKEYVDNFKDNKSFFEWEKDYYTTARDSENILFSQYVSNYQNAINDASAKQATVNNLTTELTNLQNQLNPIEEDIDTANNELGNAQDSTGLYGNYNDAQDNLSSALYTFRDDFGYPTEQNETNTLVMIYPEGTNNGVNEVSKSVAVNNAKDNSTVSGVYDDYVSVIDNALTDNGTNDDLWINTYEHWATPTVDTSDIENIKKTSWTGANTNYNNVITYESYYTDLGLTTAGEQQFSDIKANNQTYQKEYNDALAAENAAQANYIAAASAAQVAQQAYQSAQSGATTSQDVGFSIEENGAENSSNGHGVLRLLATANQDGSGGYSFGTWASSGYITLYGQTAAKQAAALYVIPNVQDIHMETNASVVNRFKVGFSKVNSGTNNLSNIEISSNAGQIQLNGNLIGNGKIAANTGYLSHIEIGTGDWVNKADKTKELELGSHKAQNDINQFTDVDVFANKDVPSVHVSTADWPNKKWKSKGNNTISLYNYNTTASADYIITKHDETMVSGKVPISVYIEDNPTIGDFPSSYKLSEYTVGQVFGKISDTLKDNLTNFKDGIAEQALVSAYWMGRSKKFTGSIKTKDTWSGLGCYNGHKDKNGKHTFNSWKDRPVVESWKNDKDSASKSKIKKAAKNKSSINKKFNAATDYGDDSVYIHWDRSKKTAGGYFDYGQEELRKKILKESDNGDQWLLITGNKKGLKYGKKDDGTAATKKNVSNWHKNSKVIGKMAGSGKAYSVSGSSGNYSTSSLGSVKDIKSAVSAKNKASNVKLYILVRPHIEKGEDDGKGRKHAPLKIEVQLYQGTGKNKKCIISETLNGGEANDTRWYIRDNVDDEYYGNASYTRTYTRDFT